MRIELTGEVTETAALSVPATRIVFTGRRGQRGKKFEGQELEKVIEGVLGYRLDDRIHPPKKVKITIETL